MLKRRKVITLILQSVLLIVVSCKGNSGKKVHKKGPGSISLGPVSDMPEGLTLFSLKRMAVYRQAQDIKVIKAVCTHMTCALNASEKEFICPCHGARFDANGQVLSGPAKKALQVYKSRIENGQLIVEL